MNLKPSPDSDSDATGSLESADYLQLYFGQPILPYQIDFRDSHPFNSNTGGQEGNSNDRTRLELDSDLASIFLTTENQNKKDYSTPIITRFAQPTVSIDMTPSFGFNTSNDLLTNLPHSLTLSQTPNSFSSSDFNHRKQSNQIKKINDDHDNLDVKILDENINTPITTISNHTNKFNNNINKSNFKYKSNHNVDLAIQSKINSTLSSEDQYLQPLGSCSNSTSTLPSIISSTVNINEKANNIITNSIDQFQYHPQQHHQFFRLSDQHHSFNSFLHSSDSSPIPTSHTSINTTPISTSVISFDLHHLHSSQLPVSISPSSNSTFHHINHLESHTKFLAEPINFSNIHPQKIFDQFDHIQPLSTTSVTNYPLSQRIYSDSLDLNQFWSSITPSLNSRAHSELINQQSPIAFNEDNKKTSIELEFSHLVAEEQCAPSTLPSPPLSSSSSPTEINCSVSQSSNPFSPSSPQLGLGQKLSHQFNQTFLSAATSPRLNHIEQSSPFHSQSQISNFQDFDQLNDNFASLINSLELPSPSNLTHCHSVSSSTKPPTLVTTEDNLPKTSAIDSTFGLQLQHLSPIDISSIRSLEPSLGSISSLPSPTSLGYPSVSTPQLTHPSSLPLGSGLIRGTGSPSRCASFNTKHSILSGSHPSNPYPKSAPVSELPTEIELVIPKLIQLNTCETYPSDLKLLLIGLQAEGAKTRVETQIKLTLVLTLGEGGTVDSNGNLSPSSQHTLARVGNWSHIKLPAYSAIKRKSKKLIKIGIPSQETLFLDVAVIRASEPHEEIFCCSNCQVREQRRTQRKRDARVRPAQEIESDEAEQASLPEDEKRKIVVFNCGQYVNFESGEVTLPTRITCYCRHHREKKGFCVRISLRDHHNRTVASSITPAIMITDDHKAVAAAAKAKSGSDADENHLRRPIRKLPSTVLSITSSQATTNRLKKKLSSLSTASITDVQQEITNNDNNSFPINGWSDTIQTVNPEPLDVSSDTKLNSVRSKRKAANDLDLGLNPGRRKPSNQSLNKCRSSNNLLNNLSSTTFDSQNFNHPEYLPSPCTSVDHKSISNLQLAISSSDQDSSTSAPIMLPSSGSSNSLCQTKSDRTIFFNDNYHSQESLLYSDRETKPILKVDVEMKDDYYSTRAGQNIASDLIKEGFGNYHHTNYQMDTRTKKENQLSSNSFTNPSCKRLAPLRATSGSQSSEFSGSDGQQLLRNNQKYQSNSRPEITCSATSSPDRSLIFPLSSRSNAHFSSRSSPKPDSSTNPEKCPGPDSLNSISPSSSLAFSQVRGGSEINNGVNEVKKIWNESSTQADSPPQGFTDLIPSRTQSPKGFGT
ncbi:hypothetical protein O181_031424, partial [Austropuccinia psidii MF-1]|nr:hypothetical protein [Austropuccinia psidii MF-1]